MRKRINLLRANKRFTDKEALFNRGKNSLIVAFFILLLINLVFYFLLFKQSQNIAELNSKKKEYNDFFLQNREADAKFAYFRSKEKQLKDILKQDVSFYPYYNLLKDSLENNSVNAQLYSVSIDKTKSTKFTISFDNYDNLINFLRFAETEDFLKNFNQLSLINFNKKESQSTKADYRLNFTGKFINL